MKSPTAIKLLREAMIIGSSKMVERNKTIALTKETHKQLAIEKIKLEYNSFEELIKEEYLGDKNE